ncbi:MAG: hypothetical protein U0T36_08320 [Saprospiraceae bacterium]
MYSVFSKTQRRNRYVSQKSEILAVCKNIRATLISITLNTFDGEQKYFTDPEDRSNVCRPCRF